MWPSAEWTIVPGITSTTIASSEVPSARFSGMPSQPASSGTMISPPPIPSKPLMNPAARPMPTYVQVVAARPGFCSVACRPRKIPTA